MVYVHELMVSPGSKESEQAARVFREGKKFSHMIADSEGELISFAILIGLKAEWLQNAGTYRAHFDITARRFKNVQKYPNVKVLTLKEFGVLLRERRVQWTKKNSSKTSTAV
jgi:hypothetical protein